MASGGTEGDDGGIPLDMDNVHMLLQVEHEQIQKRTFTNWINAQLAKRSPPSCVSDLFSDLRDGSQLLDLLEVMSGQPMKRQRGRGLFQHRANIETAIQFLKRKSIKLVNINISDIIDGRPSIILGLVWTIILHCHIEELACALSFSSRHSSLDSLTSLDSWSGSPVPASPVPPGRTSPLHRHFRLSAKKALLMWVRDQCQRVGSYISVRDFKSSWRSGEAFLVILCALRPQLVDLSLVKNRSNQENLEEAFLLAERELHIPRLLEPQDVDVNDPEEKSIMTYVAQFLQYSTDMPAPDDHLQLFPPDHSSCFLSGNLPIHFTSPVAISPVYQVSPCERAQEMTRWLQQAYQELSEAWTDAKKSTYAEKYRVFQNVAASFAEQSRPLMTTIKRHPGLSQEQHDLRAAWDCLEQELQKCKTDLDLSLPPPLSAAVVWLQRAEDALTEECGKVKDHAGVAKEARAQQEALKTVTKEMSQYVEILDGYNNIDASGNVVVPPEKFEEIKRRLTHIRVTAKYHRTKLEYKESRHAVLDLLGRITAKVQTWRTPYRAEEDVRDLLQDWHETVEHQVVLTALKEALQNLKEKAVAYTSKAALGKDLQLVTRQVKEAEHEAELVTKAVMTVRGTLERTALAWESYNKCLSSLQRWLEQNSPSQTLAAAVVTQDITEWASCQAKLNEVGKFLTDVTETLTSRSLAEQLSKVNMQWAECIKRAKFEVSSESSVSPQHHQMVHSLVQEASCLLRQPLEVASAPLKSHSHQLQVLRKKLAQVNLSSLSLHPDFQMLHKEKLLPTLLQELAEAEATCEELQKAASNLEGCLAELDHWSTDALEIYQQLKDKQHRGQSALEPAVKVLIPRGLQLKNQTVTGGHDLQKLVAEFKKTSPLQHLSTSSMQDRILKHVSFCQEILEKFSFLGFKQHDEPVHPAQREQEAQSLVVAKFSSVEQISGKVKVQHHKSIKLSSQDLFHVSQQGASGHQDWPLTQHMNKQDLAAYNSDEEIQMKTHLLTETSDKPVSQKGPALLKHETIPITEEMDSIKSRTKQPPNTQKVTKTSPQPPTINPSEVHSKAQSMAKSRLERTRLRLQGRIQQAIKLFGSREISDAQAKKKQKALKILQPAILEEFLDAVEGFGSFCSGTQLHDLMLLSDSVKKQWEDIRREMAAFVSMLCSVVHCEMQTNFPQEATDQTDRDVLHQQQAATEGAASAEQCWKSLEELCETLAPTKSLNLAMYQLKQAAEVPETQPSDICVPADSRRQQPGGSTLLGATGMQPSSSPKQSVGITQLDFSLLMDSVPLHLDILSRGSQDVPQKNRDHPTLRSRTESGTNQKPSLRAPEQLLTAWLLKQTPTHVQALVKGDTVETKQEAERTVISEELPSPQTQHPSDLEALDRYRKSCWVFQRQLQTNKQRLEKFLTDSVTISTLQDQKKQLEARQSSTMILKKETDTLWFDLELHYGQLSQSSLLMTREDLEDVESNKKQLILEWRGQQVCLQSRMDALDNIADLIKSTDDQEAQITQALHKIIGESVEISSYTSVDPRLLSALEELDVTLQSEIKRLSEQISDEKPQPGATSPSFLYQALCNKLCHLQQLREQLELVHLAAQGLDGFLATMREVKAEIPKPLANQDPNMQQNKADWEQEKDSWRAVLKKRLQTAAEQSENVDSSLKAAGMTLTVDGATVTCQDVVTSLSKHVVDVEKKLVRARTRESKDEVNPVAKEKMLMIEDIHEVCRTQTGGDKPEHEAASEQENPPSREGQEAKRSWLKGQNGVKTQEKEQHFKMCSSEGDVKDLDRRGRVQVKRGRESSFQRRVALLGALREMKLKAEQLGLQEPTLPALQHRSRVLTELESRLAGLLTELQDTQDTSSSGTPDLCQTREVEDLYDETTEAVTGRMEQCRILTELLKKFQSIRGKLSGMLHRAESTISEQASYMVKDNLQRIRSKVQETKAELKNLGEQIEEMRSVCRQLDIHLRQIPKCTIIPFESEADALMDQWLDICERTDSHLDNLHVGLNLWDGVLRLGADIENWTSIKVEVFAESASFQTENDIKTLQEEIEAQENNIKHFHRKATEIQLLLHTTELPLELQMVGSQIKKKMEQLKELVSEAEDVYRQTVAAKEQITVRLQKSLTFLQNIKDSLFTLSGSNVAAVLAKLKDLCCHLQTQEEQADSLLEDLRVLASIASPDSLQLLFAEGIQLQEQVRNTHQLFSEVQEQTEKSIQDVDRLFREKELLELWLKTADEKSATKEDSILLQEEALQQRVRAELLRQLVSSLQNSRLQEATPVEESRTLLEQYNRMNASMLGDAKDEQSSLNKHVEEFQALSVSTQSWVRDLSNTVVGEHLGIQTPVEQRLRHAPVVENTQTTEQQGRELLQTSEPRHRILQAEPEHTSSYLAQRQEAYCRVQELTCQIAQLPTLFPWPGNAERKRAYNQACQLCSKATSLQLTLTTLAQQRSEPAEKTGDIWEDAPWTNLEFCSGMMTELKGVCSRLEEGVSNEEYFGQLLQDCHHKLTTLQERMSSCQAQKECSVGRLTDLPALEASLQEVTDMEKDLLQLAALKDSVAASSTAEAKAILSQHVGNLQDHKRAVENSIRDDLSLLRQHYRAQQVKEQVCAVQTALKDLDEDVRRLTYNQKEFPELTHLKRHWSAMQVNESRLTELAARVDHLHKSGDLNTTQEIISGDVILTIETVSRDLNSLRTIFIQKKHECSKNTSAWMRQVIDELHQWSQTVQTEPLTPKQVVLDKGLQLQQHLHEVLSEKDFLLNCFGTESLRKLEKCALYALSESTSALETLSKHQAIEGNRSVEDAAQSAGLSETTFMCNPELLLFSATEKKEDSDEDQVIKGILNAIIQEEQRASELGTNTNAAADDSNSVKPTDGNKEVDDTSSARSSLMTSEDFPHATEHSSARPETFKINKTAQEPEKIHEDVSVSPKNVVTIILNMEPQDRLRNESVAPETQRCSQEAELCSADLTKGFSKDCEEQQPGVHSTLTNLMNPKLATQSEIFEAATDVEENECEDTSARPKKVFAIVLELKPQDIQQRENVGASTSDLIRSSERAELCNEKVTGSCTENPEAHELMHSELLSSKSCHTASECQPSDATAAQTSFPGVKLEEVTDFCLLEKQTMSSVTHTVEDAAQTRNALTETQVFASDSRQKMAANSVLSPGRQHAEVAPIGSDLESPKFRHSKVSGRRDELILQEEGTPEFRSSLGDMGVSQRQLVLHESMEPERTLQGSPADLGAGKRTNEWPEACKQRFTMKDILSDIQSKVEESEVINRTPYIDIKNYLQFCPDELEIGLLRTVQQVLACRYQPTQLDIKAMATQLKEAEEYSRSVQEHVAKMRSWTAAGVCDSNVLKRAEEQCSAALLDASATLQVKAAQLEQIKQYHKQMKMTRAFLEVLAAEKEKMSIDALGSSADQADKLHALMQTMRRKKSMLEELCQLSVHLSDAESSGALLAWLRDVQEEWRLLEGSIRRSLQQALNSTSQFSFLMKEAEQLKVKLEALHKSDSQSNDSRSDLELVCLTTDFKLYIQLYLQLKSQMDALLHFSLGQKEKDEIQQSLQELQSLLHITKKILDTSVGSASPKINKQLRDLIKWAKQAENHISVGKKLSLFPEEARIQIAEMKKFQADILSKRSKMQAQVQEIRVLTSDSKNEESDQVVKTAEDLYEAIVDSLDHVLGTMDQNLQSREKLLSQLASIDAWLAEAHATRAPCRDAEKVSKADLKLLECELQSHKSAIAELESQLSLVEVMAQSYKDVVVGLGAGDSRYLVNRLSGLWTEINALLAHDKATSWELEELIRKQSSSDVELSSIQASLKVIANDLEQQRFPLTLESLSTIACLKHMLIEHHCQVQELQRCQDSRWSSLLHTVEELQEKCTTFGAVALEKNKYLYLSRQMEEARDTIKEQIQCAKDSALSLNERFALCQKLLVELPFVKKQCHEARDQLEVIAQEIQPSELTSERQRIHHTAETLASLELSVTDDIKNLEAKLLSHLQFDSALSAVNELIEMEEVTPVSPDQRAIDDALQRSWVMRRNLESWMRVLTALGQKEKVEWKNLEEFHTVSGAAMQKCLQQMESFSQAGESLKSYQRAIQGALGFLHNTETTFWSAPGRFLDPIEEQKQTQHALKRLEDGFQSQMCHLTEQIPQQGCISQAEIEQLHISVLSQLLVGRAVVEAQAQLRLDLLQRCLSRQQNHRVCHEELLQHVSGFEARLSECAALQVTSYDKCVAQQQGAMLLMEELHSIAGKIEDLEAGCPNQACGSCEDSKPGALWGRWVSSRQGVSLLCDHIEQKGEEWKDITTSMDQCCSLLARLQVEELDDFSISLTRDDPQEFLTQAEMHHAGVEQAQQALASLEHRLEHALSFSASHDPMSPVPVGETLMKIQESISSLKERNLLVVAAALAEEGERQQIQEKIEEVEKHVLNILPALNVCSDPVKQQEVRNDLFSQKTKLEGIMEAVHSRYALIPAEIRRRLQEVQLSLQRAEEKLMVSSSLVQKLAGRVVELVSGLELVKGLLEQRSPTVNEARNVQKHVWDKLDVWHSRLMLLESEVQDLAEEQPGQALILMDQLTQPLQLYQNTAQMAEQRTSFLSKIPAYLQEFEDILYSATCWLDEAQTWLNTDCSFTTARSIQNHANSLQLVLDDSDRIRDRIRDFRLVLGEISAVCDISPEEDKLQKNDQKVHQMQRAILEPLQQLLQAVEVVEAVEAELKAMKNSIPKIKTILSSMENSNIAPIEHLQNGHVILASVQSMQRTLEEMEKCRGELRLPQGGEESLTVFSRAKLLLQQLEELKQDTQRQASMLQNQITVEEETDANPGITTATSEAFEMSISEEEEEEDDESCHSSSSDTLTCSIPEDPEDTYKTSDVQNEAKEPEFEGVKSLPPQCPSDVEASLKRAEQEVQPVESGSDTKDFGPKNVETGLRTMDSKAEVETAPTQSLMPADTRAATHEFSADSLEQNEALVCNPPIKSFLAAAALESTRLIPARPITPFTGATSVFIEEGGDVLSTDMVSPGLKLQQEVCCSWSRSEESQAPQSIEVALSSADPEDDKEQQSWSRLRDLISQKLTTLKKVLGKPETLISAKDGGTPKLSQKELVSSGSFSAVVQQTHNSISMLRQTVRSAADAHPGVKEELYEAVRRVMLCVDSLTDFLSTPCDTGDHELQLLQQECILTDLGTLAELLDKTEPEIKRVLVKGELDGICCLSSLRDCLHTVQLVVTSSHNQLVEHLGLKEHQELSSKQLSILDEFDLGKNEIFPCLKNVPGLECMLGRHLRESPGEKTRLQQASRSLLQGIIRLLDLGEECKTEAQMSQVQNRSQLQAVLCRHKKLLQFLGSQLAFVQHLFQREPEALKCLEDERVQLEVRARTLQQQALEQEVAFQTRLQVWTRWEDNCGQLGRVLDELEAFIGSGEPEREDEKCITQHQLDAWQQTLDQLDENSAALGLLQDQRSEMLLQTEPVFASSLSWAGGALEMRWRKAYRRTMKEVQRRREMQNCWTRFQTEFGSVSRWLVGANKHLKTVSDLADTSDLNQECVHRNLIKLLDFSKELEAMLAQKTSVSRDGTKMIHLREADSPGLRAQLIELDVSWSQLTSDLSNAQDRLQQRLVVGWPPLELLSDVEDWLKRLETQTNTERETALRAKNAADIKEVWQNLKNLKAGVVSGQSLLDFLSQPGPQVLGADVPTLRSERTSYAERLGALRLQGMAFERELKKQICAAERMHHTCAAREKQLQHLNSLMVQQKEQLNKLKQLTSQTQLREALEELEAVEGRLKEVASALREIKATRVDDDKEEVHPCDAGFCVQADGVLNACRELCQQFESLRPDLEQTVADWSSYVRGLRQLCLHCTRVRCELEHQRAPLLSPTQAQRHMQLLQQLEEKAEKEEELLWTAVEKSFLILVKNLHADTAKALSDEMERERRRWANVMQEIKDERVKTAETVSLWQEHKCLSENCSLHLQSLWHQWEELSSSSLAPERNTEALLHSVEKLQSAADDLQRGMGDVLAASKTLIRHLEPLAANLIQSETRVLSRDLLVLTLGITGTKTNLQENIEEQKVFNAQLEALDTRLQSIVPGMKGGFRGIDCVQVLLELSGLFSSLVDVRDLSGYVTLNNQDRERLQMLSREWIESMTRTCDRTRELQVEHLNSQNFEEKCESLASLREKLNQEASSAKAESFSRLQEMLTAQQGIQADVITGQQLLQSLLCDAVSSMEKQTEEQRCELVAQVSSVKQSWLDAVARTGRCRSEMREQLSLWRTYRHGLKLLWKLLRDVEPLLPPSGPAPCALLHLTSCRDDHQCMREALRLHSSIYTQTLEAGRRLCEAVSEAEGRSQLRSECRSMKEVWERSSSLLERGTDRANETAQKWTQCQDAATTIASELDELQTRLKWLHDRPEASDEDPPLQEIELVLQRSARGLRDLDTMKTDLSQYVEAGDSALLEQQLELLHRQWEELCTKVSLRRQEIADRINAWTIFNDKNKEFCEWLTQMENKVCHSGDLSIEEMVEKLKKDCMEEINLFSENKSHLKQLGEQLLSASDQAKQTQVHSSLQEVNQRWHSLFHHIEARVKKLKETLATVQQLDKNMSSLRSWLFRMEAELSRPITYSVCHHQEIQKRLSEQQELQKDIEQHTEGVASVLSLCYVLLLDEDAAGGAEEESDSLQETSRSLDQRWRTICALALDRRLRIEETWRLWCKFLEDYSRFEDWLKMAERTAANPNSADVLYTVAKEELKKFEGFQRQVHERLTQLELVNNQYRRLARENRTDRASQLKAMVHEGNKRWDALHRRVAAILRRLKYFTSQREDFEGTRESMLVWLTELDLQLTNVEHFSESDVHHKMQQLNSFQKEITLNTERIDGLIVFGEGLIQKSSPQDAALIEEELEELHSYCQEVFSRLVRFHQRLSQPPMVKEETEGSSSVSSLETSLELFCRPWLGRSHGSLPATPTHLLTSPLERSGRETPLSVDSLALEWDPSGDVGGSSSHEDDDAEDEEEGTYFSALSVSNRSNVLHDSSRWLSPEHTGTEPVQPDPEEHTEALHTLTSTPLKPGYLRLMSQCSGSIENIKRVSLILEDEEQPLELGLTGLTATDKQAGVIERWELLQAQPARDEQTGPPQPQQLVSDLNDITLWLEDVIARLDHLQRSDPAISIKDMESKAKELKEMQKAFTRYKSVMLSVNLRAQVAPQLQAKLGNMNRDWSRACTGLQQWDSGLRKTLMRCQEFHETVHSLLLWLAHAESRRYALDISHPDTAVSALQQHRSTLTDLQEQLTGRRAQQASLHALWSQLQPKDATEESAEAQEKLHVTGSKLKLLLQEVEQDLRTLQLRLDQDSASGVRAQRSCSSDDITHAKRGFSSQRERREPPPPRSFFYRVLRAAFPLHLLLLLLLLLPCLIPLSESDAGCTVTNNFARSFHPMLHYTNGPPPT